MPEIRGGFHEVPASSVPELLAEAACRGVPAFTLSTGGRTDKEAFFRAVRETLPLDPPLSTTRHVWDALADSLWNGLHDLDVPHAVVVWPDAGPVAEAHGDYAIALDILRDLPPTLADPRYTGGRHTELSVYVASAS
ncbi:barstar family protein [Streptomyces sp. NPDC098101]|uniref:barstar family protein n=1 Tax=Streptomyces sp. NPDC098101 TaxID=3366096 RepID=UPI0038209B7B